MRLGSKDAVSGGIQALVDRDEAARQRPASQMRMVVAADQQRSRAAVNDTHQDQVDGERRPCVAGGIVATQKCDFVHAPPYVRLTLC